jgi:hypothetical protein
LRLYERWTNDHALQTFTCRTSVENNSLIKIVVPYDSHGYFVGRVMYLRDASSGEATFRPRTLLATS